VYDSHVALDLFVDAISDKMRGYVHEVARLVPEMSMSTTRPMTKQFLSRYIVGRCSQGEWPYWSAVAQ
jgi:hypothetical protein